MWLVDPKETRTFATLQREFKGDAVTAATLSPDRRRAAVVFESGRAALVSFGPDMTPHMRDFIKERTLFAGFVPGRNDRLVTTSDDGWIRQWDVVDDEVREIAGQRIPDVAVDWIAFSDDGKEMLAVGDNRAVYVIDQQTHRIVAEVEHARMSIGRRRGRCRCSPSRCKSKRRRYPARSTFRRPPSTWSARFRSAAAPGWSSRGRGRTIAPATPRTWSTAIAPSPFRDSR